MDKRYKPIFVVHLDEIKRVEQDKEIAMKGEDYSTIEECVCGSKVFYLENVKHKQNKDGKVFVCRDIENHCAVCGQMIGGWTFEEHEVKDITDKVKE